MGIPQRIPYSANYLPFQKESAIPQRICHSAKNLPFRKESAIPQRICHSAKNPSFREDSATPRRIVVIVVLCQNLLPVSNSYQIAGLVFFKGHLNLRGNFGVL